MPVRKFRSIEEMNAADSDRWLDSTDPRLADRIALHWSMWKVMLPPLRPLGVRKYRSTEEMNRDRERWEDARIAQIGEARRKK
jgi:hypothetical protein